MDRRSWLWRKKSSEKSPGESESSGSFSSERFSDDQASPSQNTQSPEVTSKVLLNDEEVNGSVKALTEKLSAALVDISVKEDLVKQHAKVAEEAVSGWEKAENEVSGLKQQLEAANLKNTALEDRVGHLEGALKECVRQLRQSREDQDVVAEKTREWEMKKSVLETRIIELQTQIQITKTENAALIESDLRLKLKVAEKENFALKTDLLSLAKELEIRVIERDLSTQAAEIASKQHLDMIKKMAKLEAECRKLKAIIRKLSSAHDLKSFSPSSFYVESSIDSQSDNGERLLAVEMDIRKTRGSEENELELSLSRSLISPRIVEPHQRDIRWNPVVTFGEINLMDDFLEMERLASLPNGSHSFGINGETVSDYPNGNDKPLKCQLEIMIQRTAELEEKLERIELEKMELETALTDCQNQVEMMLSQLKQEKVMFVELHRQLDLMNELKETGEEELEAVKSKLEASESQSRNIGAEIKALVSKICSLEEENERERALAAANVTNLQKLEAELSMTKQNTEFLRRVKNSDGEFKQKQEKDLAMAAVKFAECQQTIASLSQQLSSLATLDDLLSDSDQPPHLCGQGLQSFLHVQVS